MRSLLVLVLVGLCDAYSNIVMRPLQSTSGKPELALIICQGASIPASDYIDLATAIQTAAAPISLWVGIPAFPLQTAEPAVMDLTLSGMLNEMQQTPYSMGTDVEVVYAGHSLGGAMIQNWVNSNAGSVKAQILMGALLVRTYKGEVYPTPTLTLGGELDGLMRVSRMAENVYRYTLHPLENNLVEESVSGQSFSLNKDFPVVVYPGFNHMSFCGTETPPSFVADNDIPSTVPLATAHTKIAATISNFLQAQFLPSTTTTLPSLAQEAQATATLVSPLITAFEMEGFNQFVPPCYCPGLNCDANNGTTDGSVTCLAGCPVVGWTEQYSQRTLSNLDVDGVTNVYGSSSSSSSSNAVAQPSASSLWDDPAWGGPASVTLEVRDSWHRVYTMPPAGTVHLPQIYDGEGGGTFAVGDEWDRKGTVCPQFAPATGASTSGACTLKMSTVSQAIYNVIDSTLDTGFQPVAATEIKTKLRSRQATWVAAGNFSAASIGGFNSLDGPYSTTVPSLCAEINQRSIDWAKAHASAAGRRTLERYESQGSQLVVGEDKGPYNAGPLWIWTYMEYDNQADKTVVSAPMMKTQSAEHLFTRVGSQIDYPIGAAAGFHYCKVLSPARAMEWIYVDALKPAKGRTQANSTVPPGFGPSSSSSSSSSSTAPTPAPTSADASSCNACVLQAQSNWCWVDNKCHDDGSLFNPCSSSQCVSQSSLSQCQCSTCSSTYCSAASKVTTSASSAASDGGDRESIAVGVGVTCTALVLVGVYAAARKRNQATDEHHQLQVALVDRESFTEI